MKVKLQLFVWLLLASVLFLGTNPVFAATLTVTTNNDELVAGNGACSLREAMTEANSAAPGTYTECGSATNGADTINFNIAGGGLQTITIGTTALPAIVQPLTIDGTTQAGGATCPTNLLIEIRGPGIAGTDPNINGLQINTAGSGSVIRGIIINNFRQIGIHINGGSNNTIECTIVGLDPTGSIDLGHGNDGIRINNSGANNRIGTNGDNINDAEERNTIGGNSNDGIEISGTNANNNIVAGNYVGLDITGTIVISNLRGVHIPFGAAGNRVGTDGNGIGDLAERNIISGSIFPNAGTGEGVRLFASSSNIVAGNYVGTDVTGTLDLGNGSDGIALISGSNNNRIGTNGDGVSDALEGNLVSGNGGDGIDVNISSINNIIAGNSIGTNATGTAALGNSQNGIFVSSSSVNTRIGTNGDGTGDTAERNLISGNTLNGVSVTDTNVTATVIAGNYIGTDLTGTLNVGNTLSGILLNNGTDSNTIGGDILSEGNLIAGNNQDGIRIAGASTDLNTIRFNRIGLSTTDSALPNAQDGIDLASSGTSVTTVSQNLIYFHPVTGILISSASQLGAAGVSENNCIVENTAGVNNTTAINLFFENNWWGDVSGPGAIATGLGDTVSANVDYIPFLTLPPASIDCPVQRFSFDAANYSILEGDVLGFTSLLTIRVNRTDFIAVAGSVDIILTNGTALGGTLASAGIDYDNTVISLSFNPGDTFLLVTIPIAGDLRIENNETFRLSFANPTGLIRSFAESRILVIDDDAPPVTPTAPTFITKQVDRTLAPVGETLIYTINFSNPYDHRLTAVVITDELDSRLEDVHLISSNIGQASIVGNTLTIRNFELAPEQTVTVIIAARISTAALAGDTIFNVASLSSPDASTHHSNTVSTLIIPNSLPLTGETPAFNLPLLAVFLLFLIGLFWIFGGRLVRK